MTVRSRVLVPVPQVLEHVVHSVHSDTEQCTGHGPMWHSWVSMRGSHFLPFQRGCTSIMRVLVCVPAAPQVLVHCVHSDQAVSLQSSGQCFWLQAVVRAVEAHAAPPKAGGVVTWRVSTLMPPPQVAEQEPGVQFGFTTQSCGQSCMLHFRVSLVCGHVAPP